MINQTKESMGRLLALSEGFAQNNIEVRKSTYSNNQIGYNIRGFGNHDDSDLETDDDEYIYFATLSDALTSRYWCQIWRILIPARMLDWSKKIIANYVKCVNKHRNIGLAEAKTFIITDGLLEIVLVIAKTNLPVVVSNQIAAHNFDPEDSETCDMSYLIYGYTKNAENNGLNNDAMIVPDCSNLPETLPVAFGIKKENGLLVPENKNYFKGIINLDNSVSQKDIKKLFSNTVNSYLKYYQKRSTNDTAVIDVSKLAQAKAETSDERKYNDSDDNLKTAILTEKYPEVIKYLSQYV